MKLRDLLVALIVSLVAGMGVLVVLNGPGLFTPSQSAETVTTIAYAPGGGSKAASATPTKSRIAARCFAHRNTKESWHPYARFTHRNANARAS